MIETKDLYIVGITTIDKVKLKYHGKKEYFFASDESDEKVLYIPAIKSDDEFTELFTDEIYEAQESLVYDEIKEGKKFVLSYEPVTRYMGTISATISLDELTQIVRYKNEKMRLDEDYFLQSINAIYYRLSKSTLSSEMKDEITCKLISLSDEYVSALITLKEGGYESSNNEVSELIIKEKFFKRLIAIEQRINLYSNISSTELMNSRDKLRRLLKRK
ncbi:MAG: hypothetical protein PUA90_05660 [bacterium]|nr:hypothetical protein [bacterium]